MKFTEPIDILYDQLFDKPNKLGMTPLIEKAYKNSKLSSIEKEQEEILTASLVIHFDIIPSNKFHVIENYIRTSEFENLHIKEAYAQYILGGGKFTDSKFKAYLIKFVQSMEFKIPLSIIKSLKEDIDSSLYESIAK